MKTYTQDEVDEIEAELYEAQELLEKQDTRTKEFQKNLNPMMQNVDTMTRIIDKLDYQARGTGLSPQLIWELKSRLEDLDNMLHGRPPKDRRQDAQRDYRAQMLYGTNYNIPSTFKI